MYSSQNREKRQETRDKNGRRKSSWLAFFFLLSSFFFSISSNAQCAMCRAALESEGNGVKAEAVNDGIVYLMIIPYLLVGAIGFVVYKTGKKKA